ncbi:MAG: lauroyl acyltransferase, partial [Alphaproteobacteria bacterium]|nr:lauroyl acyltransferase [Alphaproteobacteria bacterium]
RIINRVRLHHASNMFPKGIRGASRMAHALKNGESLALLIDQKMNEGVAVPFFGHDAMTAPAIAQLAVKYGLAIIPARVVRTRGAHFRATAFPPLAVARSGDEEADTKAVLLTLHKLLEEWIRERPEQWLWIHRRWPKEFYNKSTK